MRISIVTMSAAFAAVLLVPAAHPAEEPHAHGACRADVEKLCKGVEAGGGRIAQCLKDKEAQVSPECKQHLTQMQEHMRGRMQEFSEACKGDVEQYCKDVQPGQGRIGKCLKQNEATLSPACKEQMAKAEHMHQRMQEVAQACTGDVEQFCKGTRPGGGRLLKCLKHNEAKLSEGRKSAIQPK